MGDFVVAMDTNHERFYAHVRATNPVERSIGEFQKYISDLHDKERIVEKNLDKIWCLHHEWQNDLLQKFYVENLSKQISIVKKHLLQLYQEKRALDMKQTLQ